MEEQNILKEIDEFYQKLKVYYPYPNNTMQISGLRTINSENNLLHFQNFVCKLIDNVDLFALFDLNQIIKDFIRLGRYLNDEYELDQCAELLRFMNKEQISTFLKSLHVYLFYLLIIYQEY
jgi:hypothetical protein